MRTALHFSGIIFCSQDLKLTNEVNARLEGFGTLLPLGGTNVAGMGGNKLSGLNLAHEFVGVTTDVVVVDLDDLHEAFGIHNECAAISHSVFLDHHAECAGQQTGGIGKHRILDLLDSLGSVVPSLMYEVGVSAYREHLNAHILELGIFALKVFELSGAYECEVGGIEEEYGPLAFDVFVGNFFELTVMVSLNFKFGYFRVDDGSYFCFFHDLY